MMIPRAFALLLLGLVARSAPAQYQVKDIQPGAASSAPTSLVAMGGVLFFRANDGASGVELWRSNGTPVGTFMVADINPGAASSTPNNLTVVGSSLFFTANDGVKGIELWRSDGTSAGTKMVADINPGASSSTPTVLANLGPFLFFAADDGASGRELWRSDGTAAGTTRVADINPGSGASSPSLLTFGGTSLYFSANDGAKGAELWVCAPPWNATSTRMVADINPGSTGSSPAEIVPFGSGVVFRATDGTNGIELWRSDGTSAGTAMVANINPGSGSATPVNLTVLSALVFFSANDGTSGSELWKSDGTSAGTSMVMDINGSGNASPGDLVVAGSTLFFSANDGVNGIEVWRCRPPWTAASTAMVKDINPGSGSGLPPSLSRVVARQIESVAHNVRLMFGGADGVNGTEPWVSNGEAAGTRMLANLNPGAANSGPASFTRAGTLVYFTANDGSSGVELWAVSLASIGGALAEPFGTGCPGTANLVPASAGAGVPILGNASFGIQVTQARPSSAAVLILDATRNAVPLPGGCTLYVPGILVTSAAPTDASGAGAVPLGIPNDVALAGIAFVTQWAVLDPNGAFLNLLSLSDGLQVVIGS